MDDRSFQEQLLTRLDVIIRLLLSQAAQSEKVTMAETVSQLNELGLSPANIATIVGKQVNYVTATLSNRKKSKGRASL